MSGDFDLRPQPFMSTPLLYLTIPTGPVSQLGLYLTTKSAFFTASVSAYLSMSRDRIPSYVSSCTVSLSVSRIVARMRLSQSFHHCSPFTSTVSVMPGSVAVYRLINLSRNAVYRLINLSRYAVYRLINLSSYAVYRLINMSRYTVHSLINLSRYAVYRLINLSRYPIYRLINLSRYTVYRSTCLSRYTVYRLINLSRLQIRCVKNLRYSGLTLDWSYFQNFKPAYARYYENKTWEKLPNLKCSTSKNYYICLLIHSFQ